MKLAKAKTKSDSRVVFGILERDKLVPISDCASLSALLDQDDIVSFANAHRDDANAVALADVNLLAPVDRQEIWAAGVTYKRSKAARMEESEAAASCYDRVYVSDRPELFLKATPHRVVGPNESIRIRTDATWNVPEPELTLVMNNRKELVGYTIGNDMSSRDIEGDNPLYLPQAKVYNQCCGVGPCIALADEMPAPDEVGIRLSVARDGSAIYEDRTSVSEMARSFDDLIHWLGRDNDFPEGVFLLTGTGIVPDTSFTLHPGDVVTIEIDGVGSLTNTVVQG